MKNNEKANVLLSRAEINLLAAGEVLREHHLYELWGELIAANIVIDSIREETLGTARS